MSRRGHAPSLIDAPGPSPGQMLHSLLAIKRDPLAFLSGCVDRHGDLVSFPLPRTPVLLVNDPAGVRRVLQDNHRAYTKQTIQYGALSLVTGSGLLTSDGQVWRRRRRLAQPAFHHSALPGVASAAGTAAQRLRTRWQQAGGVLDADAAAGQVMLEVVGSTLFAADLAASGAQVVRAVDGALRIVVARAQSPLPGWLPTPSRARLARANATLDRMCARIVRERRAGGVEDGDDVLGLLLRATAEGLSDAELRDELVTLVIAGHETVAACLTWTLHLLSRHQPVQQRLAEELDAVLTGRPPRWADLPRLSYTRAVVDEALRLYPPAWVITRRAGEDDVICGVPVPAGSLVIISPWLLHRRARSWPDPLRFDPGRFLDGGERTAARSDYIPFGAGPRLCIGRDFALVEAVLVLAGLLRGQRVVPVADAEPGVDALVTLRPRGGLPLRLQPR